MTAGIQVELPVVFKAGDEFMFQADRLAEAFERFAATAYIPSSAIGFIGPGRDALDAYQGLLGRVSEYLHDLRRLMGETGGHLVTSAASYERVDRGSYHQVERAGTVSAR